MVCFRNLLKLINYIKSRGSKVKYFSFRRNVVSVLELVFGRMSWLLYLAREFLGLGSGID